MLAVLMSEFGPPAVLRPVEAPDPLPEPGQVVVDVVFANVTFVETQIRAGRPPNPAMLPELPAVLGNGVGGTVASVGAGVDPAVVGARVITATGGAGGYAQRAAAAPAGLIEVPAEFPLDAAVALLADGRTALALTRAARPLPGETVLVEAAAGGVGSLLVQLAKAAGARVVAAAGGPRKLDLARDLGADICVDYRTPDWPNRVKDEVGAVDIVYDGVGGDIGRAAFTLLGPARRYAAFGMAGGAFADIPADTRPDVARVSAGPLTPTQTVRLAREALAAAVDGRLRPVIGQRFPLARAADAHTAIEARGTLGKTLLVAEDVG